MQVQLMNLEWTGQVLPGGPDCVQMIRHKVSSLILITVDCLTQLVSLFKIYVLHKDGYAEGFIVVNASRAPFTNNRLAEPTSGFGMDK